MGLPAVVIRGGRIYFNTRDGVLRDFVLRCVSDIGFFCRNVLGHLFYREFTGQQLEVLRVLGDQSIPRVAVCSWRDFGKTTLLMGFVVHQLLFRRRRFVVYIGASYDSVAVVTEDIKGELVGNEWVRDVFGSFVPKVVEDGDRRYGFSRKMYYLCDPVDGEPFGVVLPRGVGQSIRGAGVVVGGRRVRPDLVVVDDLETDEVVTSEGGLERIHRWFNSTVRYLVDIREPEWVEGVGGYRWVKGSPWRMIVMDTKKHDNALIGRLLRDRRWYGMVLPKAELGVDGEWRSCVPELFSDEDVREEIRMEEEAGTFELYAREMLCSSGSDVRMRFSRDMFRYYSGRDYEGVNVFRYIVVDPARSIGKGSSYTGVLCFGVSMYEGCVYVIDYELKRMGVDEIEGLLVDWVKRYVVGCLCIEDIGLRDWIRSWVDRVVFENDLSCRVIWLSSGKVNNRLLFDNTKEARVATVLPLYKSGMVLHRDSMRDGVLERHLLSYPDVKVWDLLDCVGYIPYILEKEGLVLSVGMRYNKERMLDYDAKIRSGVWRVI